MIEEAKQPVPQELAALANGGFGGKNLILYVKSREYSGTGSNRFRPSYGGRSSNGYTNGGFAGASQNGYTNGYSGGGGW